MKLIERYIFAKLVRAFFLSLVALTATVWLTQALRQFDLVSAMGQTLITFFQVTLLLLPPLATVVAPVAVMIAVIYTFNSLNDGSELAVINATGTRQWSLLKPVLMLGIGVTVFMAAMTLYMSPLALRLWRETITNVQGNVLTSILREGEFVELSDDLIFQLRQRAPDGTLRGIFMSDSREAEETIVYLAERGAVLDSEIGVFLVMSDGTIQRRNEKDNTISIIQFTSYAFDLSTYSSRSETPPYRPRERTTSYLFSPDLDDKYYRRKPETYAQELYTRFSTPLNAMVFALLPLMFLSQAETTRQSRSTTISMASGSAMVIAGLSFTLSVASGENFAAAIALFVVPLGFVILSITLILIGIQPRPPERLLILSDKISLRVKRLLRIPVATVGASAR
ncbi:LptF/LptG family permease [Bauldia litoralis]|uniref:Lipopolysaccharide export system permease protein n=1 Tax=Bauldia litoralis TaxID=665467 RepID=A0A1G6DGU9_9HYPH|nr:LptF/LptG family permease [Bauldia litoralis]SDB44360.1 lipopolysaccharide export system permease protein [Bauldia litoralis]